METRLEKAIREVRVSRSEVVVVHDPEHCNAIDEALRDIMTAPIRFSHLSSDEVEKISLWM